MKATKLSIYTLLLFISTSNYGQSLNPKIQRVVDSLVAHTYFTNDRIYGRGDSVKIPIINSNFNENIVDKIASDDELIRLMDYQSTLIKCYAFKCLAKRHSKQLLSILLNNLNSKEGIFMEVSDVIYTQYMTDYFIELVTSPCRMECYDTIHKTWYNIKVPCWDSVYRLTKNEIQTLDSTLIFTDGIDLGAKNDAFNSCLTKESYYDRIRQLVTNYNNINALQTLAKYKKRQDIELIKSFLCKDTSAFYALESVKEFPDSSFYPLIVKLLEKEKESGYYNYGSYREIFRALTMYPTKETCSIFEQIIQTPDTFHCQHLEKEILVAIALNPNKIFEPLKKEIKLPDDLMEDVLSEFLTFSPAKEEGHYPCKKE